MFISVHQLCSKCRKFKIESIDAKETVEIEIMKPKVQIIKFSKTSSKENIQQVQSESAINLKSEEFECLVCDQCFDTKKELSEHHLNIHEYVDEYHESTKEEDLLEETFTCHLCQEKFSKKYALNTHLVIKHLNRKLECQDCEIDFDDFITLGIHMRFQHGTTYKKQCHICDKVYNRSDILIRHYIGAHLKKKTEPKDNVIPYLRISCPLCKQTFVKVRALSDHLLDTHIELDDPLPNPLTNESIKKTVDGKCATINENGASNNENGASIKRKRASIDRNRASNMKAKAPNNVHGASNNVHGASINVHEASFNENGVSTINEQIEHGVSNDDNDVSPDNENGASINEDGASIDENEDSNGQNLLECDLCNQSFILKEALNKHLMVKHLDKKFECQDCDQDDFEDFGTLHRHIRSKHGKEPTLQCHICGKVCTRSQGVIRHTIEFHLRGVGNQCKLCPKKFASARNLREHVRAVHEKLRFHCDLCLSSFSSKYGLKLHMKSKHTTIRKDCKLCQKSFNNRVRLSRHLVTKHNKSCDVCETKFDSKSALYFHVRMNSCVE